MDDTSVCRVCAGVPNSPELTVQFSTVSRIYHTLTSLKPSSLDLPEITCQSCYTKLVEFDDFRTLCLEASEKLQKAAKAKHRPKAEPFGEEDKPDLDLLPLTLDESEDLEQTFLNVKVEVSEDDFVAPEEESNAQEDQDYSSDSSEEEQTSDESSAEDSEEEEVVVKRRGKRGPYKKRNPSKVKRLKRDSQKRSKMHCDKCNRFFYDQKRFEGHQRVHLGQKEAKCDICQREFSKWYYLHVHHKMEHSEGEREKFACEFPGCDAVFKQKHTLAVHHKKKHEPNPEPETPTHVCDECGKTCTSATNLRIHKYSHGGNHPIPCTICERRFESQSKLKVHMMRHQGIKRYTCSVCGMKKTTVTELKIHMNTHTREKVFPCDLCNAVFSTVGGKSRHVKVVHQGIKAFKCTFCEKSFGKAETLKHHVMTHTGEKPHACDQCDRRFIQLVALQSHKKTHNKGF